MSPIHLTLFVATLVSCCGISVFAVCRVNERRASRCHYLAAAGVRASGVAHDVNNILASITASAELSRVNPTGFPPSVTAVRIKELVAVASRMNQQLLPSARSEGSDDVMAQISSMHSLLATLVGSALSVQLDSSNEHVGVRLSAAQLDQIIINLVSNARDAGARHVRISARVQPSTDRGRRSLGFDRTLILSVEDNGAGMSLISQKLATRMFYTRGKPAGMGLGLSTVRRCVRRIGGKIKLSSAVGIGTTVTIAVPCRRAAVQEQR